MRTIQYNRNPLSPRAESEDSTDVANMFSTPKCAKMFESMCHAEAAYWIIVCRIWLTCENSGSSIVTLSSVILSRKSERSRVRGNSWFQKKSRDLHFVHVQDEYSPGWGFKMFQSCQGLVTSSTDFFSGSPGPHGHRDTQLQERGLKSDTKPPKK